MTPAAGAGPPGEADPADRAAARGAGAPDGRDRADPRRALVTGGAVRVGRAIALALGGAGWDVAVHCHRSRGRADDAVRELEALGREAFVAPADLADPAGPDALLARVGRRWDGLDLLVNSAAIFPRARPEDVTAEAWDRVFALNARAPFLCARAARPLLAARGGSVVNIADVAAFEAWPSYVHYAASKAALVSQTRGLARAWAPAIRVNAVAPGPVLLPEGSDEEERRRAADRTAAGRVGDPRDVAEAVLYLADAEYVTGEVLRVDGGAHLV